MDNLDCSGYTCSLDSDDVTRAKAELNEDPVNRMGAVEQLRKWVLNCPYIKFPTDTQTLLMYLRHAKFSQLRAREVIEKTCALHSERPDIFKDFRVDEHFLNMIRAGVMLPLPGRGERGQYRVLFKACAVNPATTTPAQHIRAVFTFIHYLLMDESVQVCGTEWLDDCTGNSLKVQKFYMHPDVKVFTNHFSNTIPMRVKANHMYYDNPLLDAVMQFTKPFMSKKMRERYVFHGDNMEKVYAHFPKPSLPEEYLPDEYKGTDAGTTPQLIDAVVRDIQRPEVQEYLTHLSSPAWGLDLSKKTINNGSNVQQTYRKLIVD